MFEQLELFHSLGMYLAGHHLLKSVIYGLQAKEISNVQGIVIDSEFNKRPILDHVKSTRLNSGTLRGAIREVDVKMGCSCHPPKMK